MDSVKLVEAAADSATGNNQRAANAGNTVAMVNLGVLLESQFDPPKLAGARNWYQRAADVGHTEAMHNLGILAGVR